MKSAIILLIALAVAGCRNVVGCRHFCAPRGGIDVERTLALYRTDPNPERTLVLDPGPEWCACRDGIEVDLSARGGVA